MIRAFRPCGAALLCAALFHPALTSAASLTASYDAALAQDPKLAIAEQQSAIAHEQAVQGTARLLPRIDFSATAMRVDEDTGHSDNPLLQSTGPGTVTQTGLQLTQPIYDAQAWSMRSQSQLQEDRAGVALDDAVQDLMQRTAQAWLGVLLAREELAATEAERSAMDSQLARANARFEAGRADRTVVEDARSRRDSVAARSVSARSALARQTAAYRSLTGISEAPHTPLSTAELPAPPALAQWQATAHDHNAALLDQRLAVEIAHKALDAQGLTARPTVNLVAGVTDSHQDSSLAVTAGSGDRRQASVGVQLRIPIFTGGAIRSREREAKAQLGAAQARLDATDRDVRLQVESAWLDVADADARSDAARQGLVSARLALDAVTQARDLGRRDDADVLDAIARAAQAERDLARASHDALRARMQLAASAGVLQRDDLVAIDRGLAPTAPSPPAGETPGSR